MKTRRVSAAPGRGVTAAGAVAALALVLLMLPQASLAQDGPPPDGGDGGGGPGLSDENFDSSTASSVDCAQNGTDAHYDEFLNGTGLTTARVAGSLTGCPNHVNWPINPTSAAVTPTNETIPAYPMLMADGATTDLSEMPGTIAIMRNGVAMFGSWAVFKVEEYEDTAFYLEADTLDPCGGHANPTGTYHYHGTAGCLQEQAGAVAGEHSPLLGWSYDGFPFYGQLGPGGVEMKMCGEDGADATHCLDACSGYEALIDEDTFTYRYYTSCGFDESFFPFTANCYRGCCPTGLTCAENVEACEDDAEIGYTDDHVPVVSTALDEPYDTEFIEGDDVDLLGTEISVNCTLLLGSGGDITDLTTSDSEDDVSGASGVASGATGIAVVAMTAFAAAMLL
ncbi:unnamed protein product [Scytosiphon promiscuus]